GSTMGMPRVRVSHRDEEALEAKMGQTSYHRLDASATAHVQRISSTDRQNHGAKGCLAEGDRVRYPDDSILHQSRGKGTVAGPTSHARTRQTDSAASRGGASAPLKKCVNTRCIGQ